MAHLAIQVHFWPRIWPTEYLHPFMVLLNLSENDDELAQNCSKMNSCHLVTEEFGREL